MKTKHKIPWAFAFALTLSGCVGPLVVNETARTVGRYNSEFVAGAGQAGVALKYTFGLSDKFDLGLQLETLSFGVRGKYAFLDEQEHGWSAALAGGVGSSLGGSHIYGDLIGSYLFGTMEPFATFRYVSVTTDKQNVKDQQSGDTVFTIPSVNFNYGEVVIGSRVWMSEHWLFTFEAADLLSLTPGLTFANGVILDAAFGYRF